MEIRTALILCVLGLASPLAQAQQLIGLYEFNGNFANSLSGASALSSLQESNGGGATTGFSSGAWTWSGATNAPGTGVRLQLDSPLSVYSIGITFQFSQVNDYRKLLDFSNATNDPGIYISSGTFEPYGLAISTGGTISADTSTTIVLTRDATDWVYLYVNGSSTAVTDGLENDDYLVADVWREWRLDKAQNFLGERTAALGIGEASAHDLPGEAAHFQQELLDPAMFGDGFFQPISLFLGEREADGFRFDLG